MAKDYGDIPTTIEGGIRHITVSGTECLCGHKWRYGERRTGTDRTVIWRGIDSVNCEKCKEMYYNQNK